MESLKRFLLWIQKPNVESRLHAYLFLPVQTIGVLVGIYTDNRLLTGYSAFWCGWTIYVLIRNHRRGGTL